MFSITNSRAAFALAAAALAAASCGSDEQQVESAAAASPDAAGLRIVSAGEAAELISTDEHIVIDVRTADEYRDGHIDNAINLDFYAADFAEQLAALERTASYVVACRSGNRSAQTLEIMSDLGFVDAADVDGGMIAWANEELPVVNGS